MKYRTESGELLEAANLRQLAELLWQTKWNPEPTLEEWMRASAQRCAVYDGSVVRVTTPEEHVEDLIRLGVVTPVEN